MRITPSIILLLLILSSSILAVKGSNEGSVVFRIHYLSLYFEEGQIRVDEIIHIVNNGPGTIENGTRLKISLP